MFNNTLQSNNEENLLQKYKLPFDLALFQLMLDFKPRNSFYQTYDEKLVKIETLLNQLSKDDVLVMSWYLGKIFGLRLTPTIGLTHLTQTEHDEEFRKKLKFAMADVFTRPDFLANSFGYLNFKHGLKMKEVQPWLKKSYAKILESYSDITLKKRKMENRQIKLRDLICVLRPNPIKARIVDKDLYKAIIEGTLPSKLEMKVDEEGNITGTESITRILTESAISHEVKQDVIEKSLDKMAINEIIRNISNIDPNNGNNFEVVANKLYGIIARPDSLRFLNPFDLVITSDNVSPKWITLFDDVLVNYVKNNVAEFEGTHTIVFDVSGSMKWGEITGYQKGLKFISLLKPIIPDSEVVFYSNKILKSDTATGIAKLWKTGFTPNGVYHSMSKALAKANAIGFWSGTYTVETLNKLIAEKPNNKFILITDEFTYDDVYQYRHIKEAMKDKSLLLYNVDSSGNSAFSVDSNIIRACGYEGSILSVLEILGNFGSFKTKIYDEFNRAFQK